MRFVGTYLYESLEEDTILDHQPKEGESQDKNMWKLGTNVFSRQNVV